MSFEIWDIGVAYFPNQEDNSKNTVRLAIVIDDLGDKFTLCPLTKRLHQEIHYKYTIQIDLDSKEGVAMKLEFSSLLLFDRLFDLPKNRLLNKKGRCPDSLIEKIEELLEEMKSNKDYR